MRKVLVIIFAIGFFCLNNLAVAQELKPIPLLDPNLDGGKLLVQALKERKSQRAFSEKEIPLDVLSNLLWAAFGINRPESGKRTAPSAHNAQEISIYVAKKEGLFLYNASDHLLEPIRNKDIRGLVGKQSFTQGAPVNLIYVFDQNKLKSHDNLGRIFYSAADTGFISQNVYLFCASEGLATVVLGWIDKPALSKAMGLSDHQIVILTQPVGYPQ